MAHLNPNYSAVYPPEQQEMSKVSAAVSHTPSTVSKSAKGSVESVESYGCRKKSDNNDGPVVDPDMLGMYLPPSMLCNHDEVRRGKCFMCMGMFPKYCEVLFHTVHLQAVMDYFEKVGIHNATDLGVCMAFHAAFIAQVKKISFGKVWEV